MATATLEQMEKQALDIPSFRGVLAFCSNMHPADVFGYRTAEHAYVASKVSAEEREIRARIKAEPEPHRVKCMGNPRHKLCIIPPEKLRPEWRDDAFRLRVMTGILAEKFGPKNPHLVQMLLATGDLPLIERNTWRDTFWGTCDGRGQNHLGRLLVERRVELGGLPARQEIPEQVTLPWD